MDDMRYAHSDGHTDICFDDSGKYLVTGGTDGEIRVWNGFEDDDPQSHHMGISVSAVALKKDILYVSSDKFAVSAYTFPSVEFDQIIAQFNTEVYHIVCNKDGTLVACGGGDFVIKVYDKSSKSLTAFNGHTGPVLSIAFDPKGKYLASSGCDGTVRIWELSSQECLKTLNLFKKSNDLSTSSTLCRLDWSSDGQTLAVPLDTKVLFYQRDLWESLFSLTDDCITQDLSIVTYSPFGKYIAAASLNGQMLVWDIELEKCVSRKLHEKGLAICGLQWNPTGNELAFCDIEGQLGIYSSPLHSGSNANNPTPNENPVATEKFDFFDDEVEEDNDDNAFDIGAIKASLEPTIFGDNNMEDVDDSNKKEPESKVQIIQAPKPPVQTSFQPSSTPVNLECRFMMWNNIGIVRCYNTEEENSIDVEFHDANVYHPLHLSNPRNHTLAALSSEALLLASPIVDDNPSKLECLHFGTWDSNKEWTIEMPEGEEIETIALGEGFAVCVTDKKYVRLYTVSGVQCEVFLLPGPAVSCTARGNQVLVVYHKGLGVEDNQCLNIMLIKVKLGGHCSMKEYFVPLSPKAFLSWLGYTDEGKPCIVDTSGVVSILSTSSGVKWIPIANTTANSRGKSDNYFIIGLSEIKQEIRCILCKGARYPSLLPRPTVSILPFSLPFCEMSTDKGRLEEENQRYSLAHKSMESLLKEGFDIDSEFKSTEKKWMDILLKMFALATRSDREYRALDIAELMPNPTIIQGAIKYAAQRHRIALAERLGAVLNKKLSKEDEEDDDFDMALEDDFSESLIAITSTPSLNSFAKEENPLKPKPLSRIRNPISRPVENDETENFASTSNSATSDSPSLFGKSTPTTNPFRANSKTQSKKEDIGNVSGIDDLLNNSMKNVASRNSNGSISNDKAKKSRFTTKKDNSPKTSENVSSEKGKSGFSLYLEENKEKIKESAGPDVSDKDIVKLAMQQFKDLPKIEKQKYLKKNETSTLKETFFTKTKSNSEDMDKDSSSKENRDENEPSNSNGHLGKRKDENEDLTTPKPKKLKTNQDKLSDTTVRKLTQFAFTKTPK
ncbi:hypothetical protein JTE90_006203 [Oedothorax gibbosus]|uniref:WD repeat and HMG-box DNA-binding protein 1 n=1 Tax=Oedothorax gibbosus TaxID=931172 RepID=A0AAV6VTC4_9ARAC|nr:hypothetical protein JTE90_006203 [Oedothorax gibbosus]